MADSSGRFRGIGHFFSGIGHFLVHYVRYIRGIGNRTQELARDPLSIRKISENDKIATFGRQAVV